MPSIDLSPVDIPPPTKLREIRTSKMNKFGPVLSGIDKKPRSGQLHVTKLGLPDDEHDLTFHGGVDKAIHQYCMDHYPFWQEQFTDETVRSRFVPGGFGENLVADTFNETNVCIGDLVRIGIPGQDLIGGENGCLLEVSLPRQPCFKLNQRFGVKNFAPRTHQAAKTGWYYRVKEEGIVEPGMEIRVIKRDHPKWSINRLHHYVHRDKTDMEIAQELMGIDVIGNECRGVFQQRWDKYNEVKEKPVERAFKVVEKAMETPRVVRIELEAEQASNGPEIESGSHTIIKLQNGMKRAYSIVGGTKDRFTLGIARDDNSRGGSIYIHDQLKIGDPVIVSQITEDIGPTGAASHHTFIVGGIGITAFLALMKDMIAINWTVELHYAVRTSEEVAFRSLLAKCGPNIHIYDSSKGERMDIDKILKNRVWNSHVYVCGPQRMLDAVIKGAADAGMAEEEVHYEVFSADASGDPFSVEVMAKEKTVKVDVGSETSLLEALRGAGFEVSSSCEVGNCGTCRVPVKCGKIEHRGTGLSKDEQVNEMLSCVSRGVGHITIEIPEDEM